MPELQYATEFYNALPLRFVYDGFRTWLAFQDYTDALGFTGKGHTEMRLRSSVNGANFASFPLEEDGRHNICICVDTLDKVDFKRHKTKEKATLLNAHITHILNPATEEESPGKEEEKRIEVMTEVLVEVSVERQEGLSSTLKEMQDEILQLKQANNQMTWQIGLLHRHLVTQITGLQEQLNKVYRTNERMIFAMTQERMEQSVATNNLLDGCIEDVLHGD
jgi:hypothetical protein